MRGVDERGPLCESLGGRQALLVVIHRHCRGQAELPGGVHWLGPSLLRRLHLSFLTSIRLITRFKEDLLGSASREEVLGRHVELFLLHLLNWWPIFDVICLRLLQIKQVDRSTLSLIL